MQPSCVHLPPWECSLGDQHQSWSLTTEGLQAAAGDSMLRVVSVVIITQTISDLYCYYHDIHQLVSDRLECLHADTIYTESDKLTGRNVLSHFLRSILISMLSVMIHSCLIVSEVTQGTAPATPVLIVYHIRADICLTDRPSPCPG